jgi:hypothetical protein
VTVVEAVGEQDFAIRNAYKHSVPMIAFMIREADGGLKTYYPLHVVRYYLLEIFDFANAPGDFR